MSVFKEDLFFSSEVREALDGLASLRALAGKAETRRFAVLLKRRTREVERLLFWFQRRQAVLRAPSPKPFLFSEFRALLTEKTGKEGGSLSRAGFSLKNDCYLMFRLTDLADAFCGVRSSLESATGKDVRLSFVADGNEVVATMKFRSGFDEFDLKGFCQRMTWQGSRFSERDSGFPFMHAVLENGKGRFGWHFSRGTWRLCIVLPAMGLPKPAIQMVSRDANSISRSLRRR